jgi:hypothetical protein
MKISRYMVSMLLALSFTSGVWGQVTLPTQRYKSSGLEKFYREL